MKNLFKYYSLISFYFINYNGIELVNMNVLNIPGNNVYFPQKYFYFPHYNCKIYTSNSSYYISLTEMNKVMMLYLIKLRYLLLISGQNAIHALDKQLILLSYQQVVKRFDALVIFIKTTKDLGFNSIPDWNFLYKNHKKILKDFSYNFSLFNKDNKLLAWIFYIYSYLSVLGEINYLNKRFPFSRIEHTKRYLFLISMTINLLIDSLFSPYDYIYSKLGFFFHLILHLIPLLTTFIASSRYLNIVSLFYYILYICGVCCFFMNYYMAPNQFNRIAKNLNSCEFVKTPTSIPNNTQQEYDDYYVNIKNIDSIYKLLSN
jgi:hypothetical protein